MVSQSFPDLQGFCLRGKQNTGRAQVKNNQPHIQQEYSSLLIQYLHVRIAEEALEEDCVFSEFHAKQHPIMEAGTNFPR